MGHDLSLRLRELDGLVVLVTSEKPRHHITSCFLTYFPSLAGRRCLDWIHTTGNQTYPCFRCATITSLRGVVKRVELTPNAPLKTKVSDNPFLAGPLDN